MASASASASTSASTSTVVNSCYEIFLNHRGPDTKKTFTNHLYHRLVLQGFRVFWDKQEMQVGDTLSSQIHEAIEAASLHVAIFSPRYAESTWCLDELVLMVESAKPIIPVFHHVRPTELRWTQGEGIYAQALRDLQRKRMHDSSQPRYNSTAIENWRTALSTVAQISGLDLDEFNGYEGDLIEEVVVSVVKKMGKPLLYVAEHPTGLDEKIEDFEKKVLFVQREHTGKPQVIGIVGSGGIGKTALVKELFNRKSSQYQKSCILFHVRENARKASLESLQKKLLKGLTQIDQNIESVSEGIHLLKTRLSSCDALVILDDVDHRNQLDALLRPIRDVLHPHSLILITSRDKGVLGTSRVEESSIYKLTGLNRQQSQELFCLHAFSQGHPLPGFEDLVRRYLKVCDGLPLSLKVFGALLYENDISFWQDQWDRHTKGILPEGIQKSLKISYDELRSDERGIFLDIACFFIGKNRDTAIRIWDASGWEGSPGFRSLQNKNLVEVDSENKIRMHDHVRDLGRDLAKNPELPRRIWRTEDFEDLLQQSSETEVRGISIHWTKKEEPPIARCTMRNLQLLDLAGSHGAEHLLESIRNAVQSPNLIWFSWHDSDHPADPDDADNPDDPDDADPDNSDDADDPDDSDDADHSFPPSWIPLKKLRVLQMSVRKLRTLWEEESEAPLQLRELIVRDCSITSLPHSFGNLTNLEHIVLRCFHLDILPDSFGNLRRLKHLELRGLCNKLKSITLRNLTRLKYLHLEECYILRSITLGTICTLEHVSLSRCESIEVLPAQLARQQSLEVLHLQDLWNLRELPSDIGELKNLKHLHVERCYSLESLPAQLARQQSLEVLHLHHLHRLTELPSDIGELKNLRHLHLKDLHGLESLPDSLGRLNQLTNLTIDNCWRLREVSFKMVEGERESICPNLQHLEMIHCRDLVEVGTLPDALTTLIVSRCHQLRKIEWSSPLSKLQMLNINACTEVEQLPSLETLVSLEELHTSACLRLRSIRGVAHLPKLRTINVCRCRALEQVVGV